MDIKDIASLIGAITGPAGLLIALLVFFRDRASVKVSYNWNMVEAGPYADKEKRVIQVMICNVGRRPIYLSHAHFKSPDKSDEALLFADAIKGVTLAEGSQPHLVYADQTQNSFDKYYKQWWKLRVVVTDAAGKA